MPRRNRSGSAPHSLRRHFEQVGSTQESIEHLPKKSLRQLLVALLRMISRL
jgi:hypothetical protein